MNERIRITRIEIKEGRTREVMTINTEFTNDLWDALMDLIIPKSDPIGSDKELISGMFDANYFYRDSLD